MKLYRASALALLSASSLSTPAWAGEEVLYEPAPEWVEPTDFAGAREKGEELVLYDRQVRLEDGTVTGYTDHAIEIRNTKALQSNGTLQFSWQPDKGDLVVHRLELVRGDQVIDLVEQGIKPEILRRESKLENRSVDGRLTAAFAIPGMAVGDILRATTSISVREQALGGAMQAAEGFIAAPRRLGMGRVRVSWPEGTNVAWGSMGDLILPQVQAAGGDNFVEVPFPIKKPQEMPDDAPGRFQVNPLLQFGTFGSWENVSALMAPHFATEGAIAPGGGIDRQIGLIKAATSDPLERAAMALRAVQDEISYLANGMDGGNYLPQSPQDTWNNRFGDCKAKSLLLLSMLRAMDIDAQVVLVDSDYGDAVSISQPVPGAFDHMIVRASIGGTDYWLDGTSEGTRIDTIAEVPDFTWALPLIPGGADLVRMQQRFTGVPDRKMTLVVDMGVGVDIIPVYELKVEARGIMGARMRSHATETDPRLILGFANQYLRDIFEGVIFEASYAYDEEAGVATLEAKGLLTEMFEIERGAASYVVPGATVNWAFDADRARSAWRDVPYQVGGPYDSEWDVTIKLPAGGSAPKLEGLAQVDEKIAGVNFNRSAKLDGRTFTMHDRFAHVPVEIASSDIPAGRTAMRRLRSGDPVIKIEQPQFYWEIGDDEIARRVAPAIAGAGKLVDVFGDEGSMHLLRAGIRTLARQYDGALADLETAADIEATPEVYAAMAEVLMRMGRTDDAISAAERAYGQKGDLGSAAALAEVLALAGRAEEALDLIDGLGLSGDDAVGALVLWSELAGYAGRADESFERLDDMLVDRPDEVTLLNSKCWVAAIWSQVAEPTGEACDRAVSLSSHSAAMLDSRALHYYRQGKIDAALADIDSALSKEPEMNTTLYLRGVIKLERGDKTGADDIRSATRIDPKVAQRFEAFGIKVPSR